MKTDVNKYEKLRLREPEPAPTYEVLEKTLRGSFIAYETFQDELPRFDLEQNWQYYTGSCKSWLGRGQYRWVTPRGTEKEKTIYWLSAWEGYFKVVIWFLEKNRREILNANLSEETKRKINDAKTFGKMQTFPLEFEITVGKSLADVYTLINCKKQLDVAPDSRSRGFFLCR